MKRVHYIILSILAACSLSGVVRAQETFRNPAMEPNDEFQQAITRGRALARQGETEGAISEFKKAARLRNDQCAECFQFIGQVYFQMAKYKEAGAAFRQAIALKPANEAELNNVLGVTLYKQGDGPALDEAVAALKRAVELSGGKLVKAHYNLGYALIKQGKKEEGVAALRAYLEASPSASNAGEVRAIIADPRVAGEKFAPGFKVSAATGEELSLERLKGKVVLLDFWASWCGPCRVEMPELKKIWKKYGGDQFVIIGVSLDRSQEAFDSYVKREGMSWPQFYEGQGWNNSISVLYGVRAIPHTVLIDQGGLVRAEGLRGGALSKKIGELLDKLK